MTDSRTERSNAAVHEFIQQHFGPAMLGQKGFADMMVAVESLQLGAMIILNEFYSMERGHAVTMVEMSLMRATERFTEKP